MESIEFYSMKENKYFDKSYKSSIDSNDKG